jgi:cellulose synthase/poly-beta-1,6-N-acetylglucosamine synthase-like glycosyltransferase
METLFWASAGFIAYVYAGYPAVLGVWAWLTVRARRPREHHRVPQGVHQGGGDESAMPPAVSVIIAARNEATRLPGRIDNVLASDYPAGRLQIIVASDGSTDRTAEALAPYGDAVELLMLPPSGKAAALNAAAARARHPILVFADARQRFAPDAIRRLVSHFADSQVGAVSGELILDCEGSTDARTASTIGDGLGAYWKYEKWLRRREAIVGSTLGVTGAIYAMRRWLWQPLPSDTLLDDVLGPMRLVLRGYRVTFEAGALAFDVAAPDASSEIRRKIRTLAGNFQLLAQEPRLIVPGVNPVWVQFVSHKIGRLLVPYALALLVIASASLAADSLIYAAAFGAQVVFYGLAAYGAVLDRRAKPGLADRGEVFHEAA